MKTISIAVILLILASVACQIGQSSDSEIQTAIAQTQRSPSSPEVITTQVISTPEPSSEVVQTRESEIPHGNPRLIWSDPGFSTQAVVGNMIYGYLWREDKLQAIDITTGRIVWEIPGIVDVLGADNEYVYVSPAEQRMDALEVNSGETVWRTLFPSKPGFVLVTFPDIIVVDGLLSHDVFTIDKSNGTLIENRTYSDYYLPLTDRIWLWGNAGIDVSIGQVLWELANINPQLMKSCDNRLVHGDQTNLSIESVDINTGDLVWRTVLPFDKVPNDIYPFDIQCPGNKSILDRVGTTIAVDPASRAVYIMALPNDLVNASEDYYLVALDKDSGQVLWNNNKYQSWLGEAAGLVLYTQPKFGLVQAYDAITHELVWENSEVILAGLVGNTEDTIIAITDCCPTAFGYSGFAGLDAQTGELLWEVDEGQITITDENTILFDYFLFTLGNQNNIVFVDPRSGQVIAEFDLGDIVNDISVKGDYIMINEGDAIITP